MKMKKIFVILFSMICLQTNCQPLYDSLKVLFSDPVVFSKRGDYRKQGGIKVYLEEQLNKIHDKEIRQTAICAMVSNLYGFMWLDNEYLFDKLQSVINAPVSEKVQLKANEVYDEITSSLINRRIRDLRLPDTNGDTIRVSDYFEQFDYTILDLWATWCKPCIEEMKKFNDLRDKYNIQFYSISFDDELEKVVRFVKKYDKFTWPIVFAGKDSHLWEDYFRIRFLPTYYYN